MLRLWSFLYASSLGVSSVAAAAIAASIYRHTELRHSAVRFVFFFFFFYLWVWSVFRGVFYVEMILMEEQTVIADLGDTSEPDYVDALGLHGVAQSATLTRPFLSFILVMGDTALMASSLWMFPMAWELSRLAHTSMDRGVVGERSAVYWYCKWIHVVIAVFFLVEAAFTVNNRGFNSRSYRILISGNMIQGITLVYVTYIILRLKWTGRKYETINGAMVVSPLYKRLKGIMIVYGMFSFQYQMISLILLFSHFEVQIPTIVIIVSTLLFNNSGTALSIIMGCSQECVFHSFRQYFPQEYMTAFYMSEPRLAIATAAAGYVPPLVNPVFVFTDIESSSQLWGLDDGKLMRAANELHDEIMRACLTKYRGYEITTCGDAFHVAFHTIKDAVEYCIETQLRLLNAEWPKGIHNVIPATRRERGRGKKMVFSGLRVRMGIHDAQEVDGVLVNDIHPVTGKVTYTGLSEVIANDIGDVGRGGEICVTKRVARWLQRNAKTLSFEFEVEQVGKHQVEPLGFVMDVYDVLPAGLEGRMPLFAEHWSCRDETISIVVDKSEAESSQEWSSASVDAVESGYSVE